MAFNGSGTYSLPAGNPVVTGSTISSTTHNATNSDIATALTNCITRDGQSQPTANLPMGGFKLTGLAAGTGAGESVRYEQVGTLNIAEVHAATSKATPVDADELSIADSAATFGLKKLTWANIKSTLKAYFDPIYASIAGSSVQPFSASLLNGVAPLHVNDIINGQFRVAQAGTTFAAPASKAYDLDGWFNTNTSAAAVFTITKGGGGASDFARVSTITTADAAIAAGDLVSADTRIEGYDAVKYLASQGGAFVLGFWVTSPVTGIHCVSVYNGTSSCVVEYTINAANTFEYKTVQVTASPVIASAVNAYGLEVRFAQAAGATYQTTAGAWNAGNFYATANQVNTVGTIGNIFALKGVTMNRGTVPTDYETSYAEDLRKCQRYSYVWSTTAATQMPVDSRGATNTTTFGQGLKMPVPMRVAQTGIVLSAASHFSASDGTTLTACTAIVFSTGHPDACSLICSTAGGLAQYRPTTLYANNAAATLKLTGAEL